MEGEQAWRVMCAQRRVMCAQTQAHVLVSEERTEHGTHCPTVQMACMHPQVNIQT